MITKVFTIQSELGMHARPATALLKLSREYQSVILLKKGDKEIQLKSMLNILSLAIKKGEMITVTLQGEDEVRAAVAVENFFRHESEMF